jgi:hypothetical protein
MSTERETFKISADEIVAFLKKILHEGNARRIVIKQGDRVIAEFPLSVGVVGAVAAPILAAAGAVAALIRDCTIEVERETKDPGAPPPA